MSDRIIGEITIERSPSRRYWLVKWQDVVLAVRSNINEARLEKARIERANGLKNLVI